MSDVLADDPSAPPIVLAPVKPVTFQDAWEWCDDERGRALISARIAGDAGNVDITTYHERHAAIASLIMTLLDRIGRDDFIKQRLREIAAAEADRAAHLAALDNPDKQEATAS